MVRIVGPCCDTAHAPRRILVAIKYRFLGDAVLATPALRLARRSWPAARISLLTGPVVAPLLQGCPYLDDSVILASRWREYGPLANFHLIRLLGQRGYDTAVLLNRAFQPALAAWCAGIPRRIGLDTDFRGRLLTERIAGVLDRHEARCNLDLMRAAGAAADADPTTELWVSDEEQHEAVRLLAARGIDAADPLIGMQPGTRCGDDARKRQWGIARFAEVADRLAAKTHAGILLFGSADERGVSEQVAANMRRRPVILTGTTTLRQVLAMIARCRLWLGNDSGLRHVAVALGVPSLAIVNPSVWARWGYDMKQHRTLVFHGEFPRRGSWNPRALRACLDAVTPDAVVETALDLWRLQVGPQEATA